MIGATGSSPDLALPFLTKVLEGEEDLSKSYALIASAKMRIKHGKDVAPVIATAQRAVKENWISRYGIEEVAKALGDKAGPLPALAKTLPN